MAKIKAGDTVTHGEIKLFNVCESPKGKLYLRKCVAISPNEIDTIMRGAIIANVGEEGAKDFPTPKLAVRGDTLYLTHAGSTAHGKMLSRHPKAQANQGCFKLYAGDRRKLIDCLNMVNGRKASWMLEDGI